MIDDGACDTEYPEPVDDQYITNDGVHQDGQATPLLATIHVVRSVQPLVRLFKSEYISSETIQAYERYLDACHDLFPQPLSLSSKEPLDPRSIAPMINLQNVRMMLHRHNLSPVCRPEARYRAVEACVKVALTTSQLMSRCMGSTSFTRYELAVSATTLLCTHLWRCMLFLVFRGEYETALILAQAFFTIGSARIVTADCGRHIAFFIRCITERLQTGVVADFEQDEELMAYVSADLQSSAENSWVWLGSETGTDLSDDNISGRDQVDSSCVLGGSGLPLSAAADLSRFNYDRVFVEAAPLDWDGWEEVEQSLRYLLERQRQQRRQQHQPRESHLPSHTIPPSQLQPAQQEQQPQAVSSGNSRMIIANII